MQKIIQVIIAIIGTFLIINAIWLAIVSNINMGVLGTFALGIILIAVVVFWNIIKQKTNNKIGKIIKYIILALFILWFILLFFIAIYGKVDNVTYKEDAVIVLGCGIRGKNVSAVLAYRLDKTVEYYNKNQYAIIVVSGGQGPQEEITEAEAMKQYLITKGIPEDKIIKEERATSTTENIVYSKEILDTKFDKEYKVVVITNNFHIYRASKIAKKAGLDATHFNAKVKWDTIVANYIRETMGVAKYWVLGE